MGWRIVGTNFGSKRIGNNTRLGIGNSPLSINSSQQLGLNAPNARLGLPAPVKIVGFSQSAKSDTEKMRVGYMGGMGYNPQLMDMLGYGKGGGKPPTPPRNNNPETPKDNYSWNGPTFTNVAKATGYYRFFDALLELPSTVHESAIQIENFRTALGALIKTAPQAGAEITVKSEEKWLRTTADELGVKFVDLAKSYQGLLATGVVSPEMAKKSTKAIAGFSSLVGTSGPEMGRTMYAVQQMFSRGRLYSQEVNQQLQSMPGGRAKMVEAFIAMKESQGKKYIGTEEQKSDAFMQAMSSKEGIKSAEILPFFTDVILNKYGKEMLDSSHRLQGEENRLANEFNKTTSIVGNDLNPAMKGFVIGLTKLLELNNAIINPEGKVHEGIARGADLRFAFPSPANEQKVVIEFVNPPSGMMMPRTSPGVSVKKDGTLTPAGGY
jgi:tape measure domain-containing protein